jgi:hypothetical protein
MSDIDNSCVQNTYIITYAAHFASPRVSIQQRNAGTEQRSPGPNSGRVMSCYDTERAQYLDLVLGSVPAYLSLPKLGLQTWGSRRWVGEQDGLCRGTRVV